jgi:hypothetical protein
MFCAQGLMGMEEVCRCLCTQALDGASMTKNLGHVLGGFEVADPSEPRKAQQMFFMCDALVHNFACSVSTGCATLSQTLNVLTPRTTLTFLKWKMLEFGLWSLFVNAALTQRCNCIELKI